jgi:hypothetical protein
MFWLLLVLIYLMALQYITIILKTLRTIGSFSFEDGQRQYCVKDKGPLTMRSYIYQLCPILNLSESILILVSLSTPGRWFGMRR